MKLTQIEKIASSRRKGAYINIEYKTQITSNKDHKDLVVEKVVKSVVRLGINYLNIADVRAKNAQKAALGVATEEKKSSPFFHKNTYILGNEKNEGKYYLQLFTSKSPKHKSKIVGYYANGVEITEEEARSYTQPSQWTQKNSSLDVFQKNIQDILNLGK